MTTLIQRKAILYACHDARTSTKNTKRSDLEIDFAKLLDDVCVEYFEQVSVCPERKFRWDFVCPFGKGKIPSRFIAIECDGGLFQRGGHTTGKGITADHEKQLLGHRSGIEMLRTSRSGPARLSVVADYLQGIQKSYQ